MRNRLRVFLPLAFAICLSFAASSYGQGTAPSLGVNNTFTATNTFTKPTILGPSTVAMLPAASAYPNGSITVTDGSTSSDCVTGGGTFRVSCISNGTAWTATSGGVGCTVSGSAGNYQINNGSSGCAGALAPTYNTSYGALNNGSTDDATANTNAINALAANGGTTLIGNNSLWTPPTSFTGPSFWETIGLQGTTILKSTLNMTALQSYRCFDPTLASGNFFFDSRAHCTVTSQANILPVAASNGVNPFEIRDTAFIGPATGSGTVLDLYGLHSGFNFLNNGRYDNLDVIASNNTQIALTTGGFNQYFNGGSFQSIPSTAADCVSTPSALLHSLGQGVFQQFFMNGCGMHFQADNGSPFDVLADVSIHDGLYENGYEAPFQVDVTNGLADGIAISDIDVADTCGPNALINVIRSSGTEVLKNPILFNNSLSGSSGGACPSGVGPYIQVPPGNSTYVTGAFIFGNSTTNPIGLYGNNGFNYIDSGGHLNTMCGGAGCSASEGGYVVPIDPPLVSATPSTSGGTCSAGTYYLFVTAVGLNSLGLSGEGLLSYEQAITTTGSTGSIGMSWSIDTPGDPAITDYHVYVGTRTYQENQFFSTSGATSFTYTCASGTGGTPAAFVPNGTLLAAASHIGTGYNNSWLATYGNLGVGTNTPTHKLEVTGTTELTNLIVTGTCTGCSSGGAVTTSGSPATGNLTKFSGAATITNGDLAGDVTTSGTLNTTVVGVNGASPPASTPVVGTNSSKQIVASTAHNISTPLICPDSSGSGTAQVCNTSPTFTPIAGDTILYNTTTSNTGDVTVNVNSLGAKHVKEWLGTSTLASGDMPANTPEFMTYDGTFWEVYTIGNVPGGTGTVTSVATTSPLGGGTITGAGTLTCTTCVVASSPGAGIAHFAGSTQTVTSSAVLLSSSAQATGQLPIGNVGSAGLSGTSPVAIASTGAISCATCTVTIGHGTATLGTSAISSGTCATVVTVSASGVATTDDIIADFNADPTSTVGYQPSTSGTLNIIKYPTTNNVNFKVCNSTVSSITPGAVTLNWRVTR